MADQPTSLLTAEIGDKDMGRQAYPVRVTLGDGSAASDWLRLSDMPPPPPARSTGRALADYGVELFERLFAGPLRGLFQQAWIAAQRGSEPLHLQLWIQSDDLALQAIPWELMHLRAGAGAPTPLAAIPQVAFSRYVDSATPFGRPIERWPLRVLVAIGAPDDLGTRWPDLAPVDYAAERAHLAAVLDAVSGSGQIEYRFVRPATPEAVVSAMEDGYQIVIFYGHGLYMPRLGTSLLMQRDDGGSKLFAAGDLIDALRRSGSRPALFILISCNTAAQRANPALDNLAVQIVRDGSVPAVVAMRDLVAVDLARAFTQYLCDYLLRYGVIDRAVAAARRQVLDPDDAGWSTPVLYMRSRDGRLFDPNAQLEFARLLSNDPQISPAALAAPAGARLRLLRARPDEQPNPQDARALLGQLLNLDGYMASPAPLVVSCGSRISRSLLLQQWAWAQNRGLGVGAAAPQPPAPNSQPPIAIYLPLADDRRLQAGARVEDLLIDAAAALDPAYGVAMMSLLAGAKDRADVRFVLLIDGVDALAPAVRAELIDTLDALARRLPDQRVVISVEEGDAPATLRQSDTIWILLSPLSERQVRAYLRYRDQARADIHMRVLIRNGLIGLARDPQLLTAIAESLIDGRGALTRDDLLSDLLGKLIDRAAGPGVPRAAARDSLYALAWELHWSHRLSMPIGAALQVIRDVPHERSYDPEAIYRALVSAGALVELGGASVQLNHVDMQAYAAARALRRRPDLRERLEDVIVMASFPERLEWWSGAMIGLAQRADSLADLAPVWEILRSEVSGPQTVMAARCLGAFIYAQRHSNARALLRHGQNDDAEAATLLDSILIELDPRFEPSAAVRALLAEALSRLPFPKVHAALRRQVGERVLLVDDLWQYDRPIVRMAAARALRDIAIGGADGGQSEALLQHWRQSAAAPLLDALSSQRYTAEERILAAFALSDLSDQPGVQGRLVALLLQAEGAGPKKEWQAVQAAIADALLLEADAQLAGLLADALRDQPDLPLRTEILAVGIVGACASHQPELLAWLYARLRADSPLVPALARAALARALACGPVPGMPVAAEQMAAELAAQARQIIEEPITADAPLVATQRRLAIETLVWLGLTDDGQPPAAIASWPLALRQTWWESVS